MILSALLVVSLLVFRAYSSAMPGSGDKTAADVKFDATSRAKEVTPLIEETVEAQRKALEQQLQ
jgi:hypothetical protein